MKGISRKAQLEVCRVNCCTTLMRMDAQGGICSCNSVVGIHLLQQSSVAKWNWAEGTRGTFTQSSFAMPLSVVALHMLLLSYWRKYQLDSHHIYLLSYAPCYRLSVWISSSLLQRKSLKRAIAGTSTENIVQFFSVLLTELSQCSWCELSCWQNSAHWFVRAVNATFAEDPNCQQCRSDWTLLPLKAKQDWNLL